MSVLAVFRPSTFPFRVYPMKSIPVGPIDYGCEDGCCTVSTSCVAITNSQS